jgi:hypothetical protein
MTTFNVTNNSQLQSALSKAHGGDTILLAAGNYGKSWITDRDYSSTVTIRSATLHQAHFDYLQVSGSSNLRFEGLDVGHALRAGETTGTIYTRVTGSTGIKMVGMAFHGSLDNNPGNDGIGLHVARSSDFQLMGSSFRELYRGAYIEQDSNVTIASNSFQMIRTDGLDVGAVNGLVIDKNSFTNFRPAIGDHADAIQFWLTNQPYGSSNISITNNTIMQGSGTGMQGIFMSDPMSYGYKNVLVENNLIYGNDQYHGIYLNSVRGAQVIGNTVLSKSTDSKMMWIDLVNSSSVTVKDNLAEYILQHGVTGLSMSHNADLSKMAWVRSLIPDLNSPASAKDLIINDYGYHLPGTVSTSIAPVATAVAPDIGSTTDTATSAQVSKVAIAETAPPQPTIEQVFPTTPHYEVSSSGGHAHIAFSQPIHQLHFDHFAALP